jgi:hypothetical protein
MKNLKEVSSIADVSRRRGDIEIFATGVTGIYICCIFQATM